MGLTFIQIGCLFGYVFGMYSRGVTRGIAIEIKKTVGVVEYSTCEPKYP